MLQCCTVLHSDSATTESAELNTAYIFVRYFADMVSNLIKRERKNVESRFKALVSSKIFLP
jgi:hypothetical protein